MLLVDKTVKKFGYHPDSLKEHSSKKVVVKCDDCGKEYYKEFKDVPADVVLCFTCSRACGKKKFIQRNTTEIERIVLQERVCKLCSKPMLKFELDFHMECRQKINDTRRRIDMNKLRREVPYETL